jgi:4-amino-4-deoxy-L-arabinose transferase-like glycosyltransferase
VERERLRASLPFAALAAVSAALTAWLLASSRIPRSADQAVVGLMARHILAGRGHPVFYWGSTYGGTLEPHLVAAAFAVFGPTPAVYRGVMAALYALLLAGTALFTNRFFGRKAAFGAALFLAVPPFFLPYKVLTSDGAYASVALLGLATAWLALAADERLSVGRRADRSFAGLGLVAGLGLWVTPATLPVAGVAFLWVVLRPAPRPRALAFGAYALSGFAGSLPWWIWNVRHAWGSLAARELSPVGGAGLLANAEGFFTATLPVFLGAARPHFTVDPHASFPGARAVVPALVLLLLAPALAAARSDRRLRLLFLAPIALCGATVLSSRLEAAEPRYLVAGYILLAPLLGVAGAEAFAGRWRTAWAGLFGALLLSNLSGAAQARRHVEDLDDSQVTGPLEPLLLALRAEGVTRAYANYWTAYRVTFESREEILATPVERDDGVRYEPLQETVAAARSPAVILLPPRDSCFRGALAEEGAFVVERRAGMFAIFTRLPAATVDLIRSARTLPMPRAAYRVAWDEAAIPLAIAPGGVAPVSVRATNAGPCIWTNAVRLSAQWTSARAPSTSRTDFFAAPGRRLAPGESALLAFRLAAPEVPGRYGLELDLEQEGVATFSSKGGATLRAEVDVR